MARALGGRSRRNHQVSTESVSAEAEPARAILTGRFEMFDIFGLLLYHAVVFPALKYENGPKPGCSL